jgi:hypothetical protein
MSVEVIDTYKVRLQGNHIMRIFPNGPNTEKVLGGSTCKVPPAWSDERFAYCRSVKNNPYGHVIPFISSKGNGTDAFVSYIRDLLINMPSWIKVLYYCDWHEPEKDYGAGSSSGIAKYKQHQLKLWEMIEKLPPATRAKVRFGHVLTKQWTEDDAKGKFNYGLYDTGIGDFLGNDAYVLSNTGGTVVTPTSVPSPVEFLKHFKAYKYVHPTNTSYVDKRPRIFPELGLIGMPDDLDGMSRANWLRGVHAELQKWRAGQPGWSQPWNFEAWLWWNTEGKATGDVPRIGNRRDFPLHMRTTGAGTTADPYKGVDLPNQTGKTQPAPVVAYNEIWTAENSGTPTPPPPDPGPTTPPPPPPPPYGTGGNRSWRMGATMKKDDISAYEPKLAGNQIFRVFPNSDGLPPAWSDPRFAYAKRAKAIPVVSSNIDGNSTKFKAMRDWIIAMPPESEIPYIYLSDRHEPENNVKDGLTREKYLANFKAWWEACIATLPPDIRRRVKAGPILTRQWVEDARKGNFDYTKYDPMAQLGLKTDVFMYDHYHDSWKPGSTENASLVADAYVDPVAFLARFKAYRAPTVNGVVDDRPRLLAELGAMGIPNDPDGSKRAAWITGIAKELDTWGPATTGFEFHGALWWNNQGTSGPSLTPIGTLRYFYLDKWQNSSGKLVPLPGSPPAPLAAYNQIVRTHGPNAPAPVPDPPPPTDPPPTDPTPDPGGGGTPTPPDPTPIPDNGGGTTNPDPGGAPPVTVPVDTPQGSRKLAASYTILVTDQQLNVIGDPIHEWSTLQVTLRWKEPGSGQFVVPAFRYILEQLVPGCRIVVLRTVLGKQSILISGPVERKSREWSDNGENGGVGKLTVTFADDMAWLAARVAYPDPLRTPNLQESDHWVYNGNPEQGMLRLVRTQCGAEALAPRRVPKLVTAAFSGLSGTGTIALGPTYDLDQRGRLEKLTDVLRRMAAMGYGSGFDPDSLGFRTRQTQLGGENVILFEVIRSRNLAGQVHFSEAMGNLKYYNYVEEAPKLTHPIVGGAGDGADRYINEFPTTDEENLAWGRFEGYVSRPGAEIAANPHIGREAANEALREGGMSARLASNAADTVDCRAGVHYTIGDIVSLGLGPGEWINAPVQTISFQAFPTAGEVVGTTIGDQSAKYDSVWIRKLREIDRRLGSIERR